MEDAKPNACNWDEGFAIGIFDLFFNFQWLPNVD
jgi:hypothetical protein